MQPYFTCPHIPDTEIKQNSRRSADTKPRPSAVLFYFSFILLCAAGFSCQFSTESPVVTHVYSHHVRRRHSGEEEPTPRDHLRGQFPHHCPPEPLQRRPPASRHLRRRRFHTWDERVRRSSAFHDTLRRDGPPRSSAWRPSVGEPRAVWPLNTTHVSITLLSLANSCMQ